MTVTCPRAQKNKSKTAKLLNNHWEKTWFLPTTICMLCEYWEHETTDLPLIFNQTFLTTLWCSLCILKQVDRGNQLCCGRLKYEHNMDQRYRNEPKPIIVHYIPVHYRVARTLTYSALALWATLLEFESRLVALSQSCPPFSLTSS